MDQLPPRSFLTGLTLVREAELSDARGRGPQFFLVPQAPLGRDCRGASGIFGRRSTDARGAAARANASGRRGGGEHESRLCPLGPPPHVGSGCRAGGADGARFAAVYVDALLYRRSFESLRRPLSLQYRFWGSSPPPQ